VPSLKWYYGILKGALFWQCHPLGLHLTVKKSHGQLSGGGGILKHYKAVLLALLPTLVASTLIILFSEMFKTLKKN
jgi:hypothetical protein